MTHLIGSLCVSLFNLKYKYCFKMTAKNEGLKLKI